MSPEDLRRGAQLLKAMAEFEDWVETIDKWPKLPFFGFDDITMYQHAERGSDGDNKCWDGFRMPADLARQLMRFGAERCRVELEAMGVFFPANESRQETEEP